MGVQRGPIYPRVKDARTAAEFQNIYDILQNLKIDSGSVDPASVSEAIGKAMKDGQLEVLNRFLTGRYQGGRILLNNTLDQGYTLYAIKGNGSGFTFPAIYFSLDQVGVETLRVENQKRGPAAWFKCLGTGGTTGVDQDAVVVVENLGSGDSIRDDSGAKLTSGGAWLNASSRKLKRDFARVDPEIATGCIRKLPIREFRYKKELRAKHMGPTAEDFYKLFGLGDSGTISGTDLASVALVGVKSLLARVDALEKKVKRLEAKCR